MNQALIGADPELFMRAGDKVIPAYGLIGGTKEAPIQMHGLPDGFMYQEDGAALEFNIPPVAYADSFQDAIHTAITWLKENKVHKQDLRLSGHNAMTLSKVHLGDARSQTIGCVADCCAYNDAPYLREPFTSTALGSARYAGGHIHLSFNHEIVPRNVFARFADIFINLPLLIAGETQAHRRQFYGMAGIYREKPYGIEIRTPSNYWVLKSRTRILALARNALDLANSTWDNARLGLYQSAYADIPWKDIQTAIGTEDRATGRMLIDMINHRFGFNVGAI